MVVRYKNKPVLFEVVFSPYGENGFPKWRPVKPITLSVKPSDVWKKEIEVVNDMDVTERKTMTVGEFLEENLAKIANYIDSEKGIVIMKVLDPENREVEYTIIPRSFRKIVKEYFDGEWTRTVKEVSEIEIEYKELKVPANYDVLTITFYGE